MALSDDKALQLAVSALSSSENYFNNSVRKRMENDIRQFQGVHPVGSKYHSDYYKTRSKLFRPKTRSATRKAEAACASAFFSNEDVVSVDAEDTTNDDQHASAAINKQLLQYRLSNTIPWFQILVGAFQEARTVGVVFSLQTWHYIKDEVDQPDVTLLPPENVRIDAAASWTDPINTSPYVILQIPMYVCDIKERMQSDKQNAWKPVTDEQLKACRSNSNDSLRLQRANGGTDPKEQHTDINDYTVIWVSYVFMRYQGTDYCYYTLGDKTLLSSPRKVSEAYPHLQKRERPVVMGKAMIETHKVYPDSHNTISKDVQSEINTNANQRIDNVRLAMDKRWFVGRNKQVDVRALVRGGSNSVTFMNDVDKDVKMVDSSDVTSSSYAEQDRLNLDFDDVVGAFSGSSVASNRKLNETVGGMQLLSGDANQMGEYDLRVFTETWVEPVLRQLVALEQHYETDEVVLAIAGEKAKLYQKFGMDTVTDTLLQQRLTLKVNVGTGSTNTFNQLEKLIFALKSLREVLGDSVFQRMRMDEIIKEVMGKVGYRDGGRFYIEEGDNPEIEALIEQINQLQAALAAKHPPELIAAQIEELRSRAATNGAKRVVTLIEGIYSSMQAASLIAGNPTIAPVGDEVLKASGYQPPNPAGVDPNIAGDLAAQNTTEPAGGTLPAVRANTSPLQPGVPASPMEGIETAALDG